MSFENRLRMTEKEARNALVENIGPMIMHLLKNIDDDSFSIMSHINCEWCDFCDEQGDCRFKSDAVPCIAKPNPYENQDKVEIREGLISG